MFVIGPTKKIVGQHLVITVAMTVEIVYIGLYVSYGKGLVNTITDIETVQSYSHVVTVGLRRAADQHHQKGKYK